jgi:hypothetical protein
MKLSNPIARLAATSVVVIWIPLASASCADGPSDAPYKIIDDMEGTSGLIEWTPPKGAPGSWSSYVDTECDHILPMPGFAGGTWSYEAIPVPYETRPGITSSHAARLRTTSPLDNTWGAGMGFDLADLPATTDGGAALNQPQCMPAYLAVAGTPAVSVDLHAYQGISFWAMATGEATASTRVWARIDDWNTDPRGGRCDPAAPDNPQTSCFNSFRFPLDLTAAFTQYTVGFSRLKQGDYGHKGMPSLDLGHVFGLNFQVDTPGGYCPPPSVVCAGVPPSLSFDIWIDDLYFVNR